MICPTLLELRTDEHGGRIGVISALVRGRRGEEEGL